MVNPLQLVSKLVGRAPIACGDSHPPSLRIRVHRVGRLNCLRSGRDGTGTGPADRIWVRTDSWRPGLVCVYATQLVKGCAPPRSDSRTISQGAGIGSPANGGRTETGVQL